MKCTCIAIENVGKVVAYVSECYHECNKQDKWLTYGVALRKGHPYYEHEFDENGQPWEPAEMRCCCTTLAQEFDGLRLHYVGRWFADDTQGVKVSKEEALRRAIDLAQQLDVM